VPTTSDPDERRRLDARRSCTRFLQGAAVRTPREQLQDLAAAPSEELTDVYGVGGDVEELEHEVADLLGKPAAVFVPSGTMAQQCALRIHADRTGHPSVGLHARSHLVAHEEAALEELHGIRMRELTAQRRPLTAADLAAHPGPLGALVVELPLRDAGYLLPSWDDLVELTDAARTRGIPVHLDGARLWEARPFYDRSLAEVAALADTVYVSFYKGLGGPSGAVLAGPQDLMDQARSWRHRHGGTLFGSAAVAIAAREGLRAGQDRFTAYAEHARALAAALAGVEGLRVHPDPPQTNAFVLYADVEADALTQAVLEMAEAEQVWALSYVHPADVPGWCGTEIVVGQETLEFTPDEAAALLTRLLAQSREDVRAST
jgi:threonine aldolase